MAKIESPTELFVYRQATPELAREEAGRTL